MRYLTVLFLATVVAISGCASNQYGPKQTIGGMTGAALGGLLGAQFGTKGRDSRLITTSIGVLLGGLMGSEIGRSMDEVDRMRANEAVVRARSAPIGQTITWNNPRNNNQGSITPVRDGTSSSGQYCREFYQTVSIGGKTEDAYGVACREEDGTWRIAQN